MKKIIRFMFGYLSVIGTIGFSLFIFEESIQTLQFSMFMIDKTEQYEVMQKNIDIIASINDKMSLLNNAIGWTNPIGWFGYNAFSEATRAYVNSARIKIFIRQPSLLIGHNISFSLKYYNVRHLDGYFEYTNKDITVRSKKQMAGVLSISGLIEGVDGKPGAVIINI